MSRSPGKCICRCGLPPQTAGGGDSRCAAEPCDGGGAGRVAGQGGSKGGGEAQALRMEAGPLEAFTPWHPWLISVSLHAITKLSYRNTKGEEQPSFRPGSGRFSASRDASHRLCGERPRGPSAFQPHRPHRL